MKKKRIVSEETRRKLSEAWKRRGPMPSPSAETRRKISEANKARPPEMQDAIRRRPKKHPRLRKGTEDHVLQSGWWTVEDPWGDHHRFRNAMDFAREKLNLMWRSDRSPGAKTPRDIRFSNALSSIREGRIVSWNGWSLIAFEPDPAPEVKAQNA